MASYDGQPRTFFPSAGPPPALIRRDAGGKPSAPLSYFDPLICGHNGACKTCREAWEAFVNNPHISNCQMSRGKCPEISKYKPFDPYAT